MENFKAAVISLRGKSSEEIVNECKNYFSKVDSLNIKDIEVHVSTDNMRIFHKDEKLDDYDCVYCRGSYKYALLLRGITEALNGKCYLPISSEAFLNSHDKFLTSIELQKSKISIPKTYMAATVDKAKRILSEIHYPVIIKIPSGTHGKGVMFVDSLSSAKSVLDVLELFKQPAMIQEYIETNATDLRVIVLGNKVVAAMKRVAAGDELRANIHSGGFGVVANISEEAENLAIKAAKILKADICAIDLLEASKIRVVEANVSPGLQGIKKATKKNLAKDIAKFLFEKTAEFKKIKTKKELTPARRFSSWIRS